MKRVALVLVVVAAGACDVEPIDLADRACDAEHPCVTGYECVDDVCVRSEEQADGGPQDNIADDDK